MGIGGVHADGQNFGAQLLEMLIFHGHRGELGGAHKGEIPGIKIQQHPFAAVVRQLYFGNIAFDEGAGFKIRGRFADSNRHI
jgi:hypothetical protein